MPGDELPTQAPDTSVPGARRAAREMFLLLYEELQRTAAACLARERAGHILEPAALVHEAYVKISGGAEVQWRSPEHFYHVAAEVMRRILVDDARHVSAMKRGGDRVRVGLDRIDPPEADHAVDTVDLIGFALGRLRQLDQRVYQVVMHRYFSGLSEPAVAALMGVAVKTVQRDWKTARTFLRAEIAGESKRGEKGNTHHLKERVSGWPRAVARPRLPRTRTCAH